MNQNENVSFKSLKIDWYFNTNDICIVFRHTFGYPLAY